MKLEQSFDVDAPVDTVWKALIDVERVAPCLPGAEIVGSDADGNYEGTFTVKIGPASASYRGKLRMEDVDESAHRAVMQANGTDKRGQGGAKATIVSVVTEREGGARVVVDTDYAITGRLARFGRGGMIEDVSKRLLGDFATCLQATLGTDQGVTDATPAGGEGQQPAAPPQAREVAGTAPQTSSAQATGAEAGGGAQAAGAQASVAPAAAVQSSPPPPPSPAPRPASRPPAQAKSLNALSLLFSVLRDRVKALIAGVRSRRRS
ncbi:MAG: SRPBCC family protein [Solirubrobacteraceae bacterium]